MRPDETNEPAPRSPWAGRPWMIDVVLIVLVAVPALAPVPFAEMRPSHPFVLVLVLLPALALPFRRRAPRVVLAVSVAVWIAALALGTLSPGGAIAMVVATYGVAHRTQRRTSVPATLAAVGAVVTSGVIVALVTGMDTRVLQVALSLALAGAVGDAARSRRAYLEAVVERARRAEQTREAEASRRVTEERLRIARDLHDAVAHRISVISLNAGVASSTLENRPDRAREALATIRTASRDVLGEIGTMMSLLRAPDDAAVRVQPGLARVPEVVESVRVAGWDVVVRDEIGTDAEAAGIPWGIDIVAYRVVQEGLTNALKHGSTRRAHVLLRRDGDDLEVVVTNPIERVPEAAEAALPSSGFGLVGLRERVDAVRGDLAAGLAPGGYRLAARLPLPARAGESGS
ncbi:sensor histidine kinase [Microbacterium sp. CFBP 8790]|uniref:histidine kinase n=1 Tax=unclassified Microbacterium TaxID=2609290 RepID=UPI001784707D|nr:sensor histidine kinase [Microbacterium sp. CFBP 8801]MBD8510766.1 sensor histidine kinase [Microbacterium sp. CFBP 8790]